MGRGSRFRAGQPLESRVRAELPLESPARAQQPLESLVRAEQPLERLFGELSATAEKVGIAVRVERIRQSLRGGSGHRGGLCTVRGKRVLLVDAGAPLPDRIAVIAEALATVELEGVDLPPVVRATIGAYQRTRRGPKATSRPLARAKRRG